MFTISLRRFPAAKIIKRGSLGRSLAAPSKLTSSSGLCFGRIDVIVYQPPQRPGSRAFLPGDDTCLLVVENRNPSVRPLPCRPSSSTLGTTRSHLPGARTKLPSQPELPAAAVPASNGRASSWSGVSYSGNRDQRGGCCCRVEQTTAPGSDSSARFKGRDATPLPPPPLPFPRLLLCCQEYFDRGQLFECPAHRSSPLPGNPAGPNRVRNGCTVSPFQSSSVP